MVFPSTEQFFKLQTDEAAHFQDMWNNFKDNIQMLKQHKIPMRLYSPGRSHFGGFLTLINRNNADFVETINWSTMKSLRLAACTQGDNWHSPGTSHDYGFCGSQNLSADGSPTGIPAPRMKEGTTVPAIANAFKVVSEAALRLQPDVFDSLDKRVTSKFARKIHKHNRLTLARESETTPDYFCQIHDDQPTNSHVMTSVFGASVIRDGVRYSFLMHSTT